MPLSKILLLAALLLLGGLALVHAQLAAGEYFFDSDPGCGNGTALSIAAGDSVALLAPIPVASLTPGRHILFLRYRHAAGAWSTTTARPFLLEPAGVAPEELIAAECFIGADPGPGNADPLTVEPGDSTSFYAAVPVSALSLGTHTFALRCQWSSGSWSPVTSRRFLLGAALPPVAARITAATGQLHGTLLSGEVVDTTFGLAPTDGLLDSTAEHTSALLGTHYLPAPGTLLRGSYALTARYEDDLGNSFANTADFEVTSGLVATPGYPGPNNLFLHWYRSPRDAGSYAIYRGPALYGTYTFVDSTAASFYVAELPATNQAFGFYRITARYLGAAVLVEGDQVTPLDPAYREE